MMIMIITGASRGFGRSLAMAAAEFFGRSSRSWLELLLVARNEQGLQETVQQISASNATINCHCHGMDLGNLDTLDANLDILWKNVQQIITTMEEKNQATTKEQVASIVLIQNAGTIGHVGPAMDSPSLLDMQRNVNLNITSSLWMAARFSKFVTRTSSSSSSSSQTTTQQAAAKIKEGTIVNISSLVAVADFPTMGIYSAGKAARDKYHSILTKETPVVKTLNYAPGPLETDMVTEIRNAPDLSTELKPHYDKTLLEPLDSARKLMRLLVNNNFESGAHVDYYDLPDNDKNDDTKPPPSS